MKILITGPRGFVASNLIQSLQKDEAMKFVTLDRDLLASEYLPFFEKERFDAVVHLATLFLKNHESNLSFPIVILK